MRLALYHIMFLVDVFLLFSFAALTIAHLALAVRYRTGCFGAFLVLGCFGEAIAYVARCISLPWLELWFLTLSPAWVNIYLIPLLESLTDPEPQILAAVYLTVTRHFEGKLPVRQACNWFLSVGHSVTGMLQVFGALMVAWGITVADEVVADHGSRVLLAGYIIQIFIMLVCMAFAVDYWRRIKSSQADVPEDETPTTYSMAPWWFITGQSLAFVALLVRCVYRITAISAVAAIDDRGARRERLFGCSMWPIFATFYGAEGL